MKSFLFIPALVILFSCGQQTQVSETTEPAAAEIREEIDQQAMRDIQSRIADSTDYIDQEQAGWIRNYKLFYDQDKKLVKANLSAESESGDVANWKSLYFDEQGKTKIANYSSSVIPEDFSLDIWAGFDKGTLASAKVVSSDSSIRITTMEQLKFYFEEPVLSTTDLEKVMSSAVRSDEYIQALEDAFDPERGPMEGSEPGVNSGDESQLVYAFDDLEVREVPFGDEGESGQQVSLTIKGSDPQDLPRIRSNAYFVGRKGNVLFIEFEEGFLRELHIYDLTKSKFVYDSRYMVSKVEEDVLTFVRPMKETAGKWLPPCDEEKAAGQGVDYREIVKVDLKTFSERTTGQILCGVAQ